jgi:hypothetical protein
VSGALGVTAMVLPSTVPVTGTLGPLDFINSTPENFASSFSLNARCRTLGAATVASAAGSDLTMWAWACALVASISAGRAIAARVAVFRL